MSYQTVDFIFFTFAVLTFFYFLPRSWRPGLLLVASLCWYATWRWYWPVILLGLTQVNYFGVLLARRLRAAVWVYSALVVLNALLFVGLKSGGLGPYVFAAPFGSSFYLFMLIALVLDHARGKFSQRPMSWLHFTLMPQFYPLLMGGPIERGEHFVESWEAENKISSDLVDGLLVFAVGFVKMLYLLPGLKAALAVLLGDATIPARLLWVGPMATLVAYVEFSAYTEMGRGVGRMFGLHFPVSFHSIMWSKNPNDFWQRWNITLGTWIRDYVSFPLMLRWGRTLGQYPLIILSFFLVGVWHGTEWHWLGFGLFNGVTVVLYHLCARHFKGAWWGRLCVVAIFVGNGLLQLGPESWRPLESYQVSLAWQAVQEQWQVGMWCTFGVWFLSELMQEKKKTTDWFLQSSLTLKTVVSLVLVGLFLWQLSLGAFAIKEIVVPVYFRI